MAGYRIYNERELLERLAYLGPAQAVGGGVTRTSTWSGAVTEQIIWTPTSGSRFIVSVLQISAGADCTVTVMDEANDGEHLLFQHTFDVDAGNAYCCIAYPVPRISADVNRKLEVTTDGGSGTIVVWGWETGVASSATDTTSTSTSSSSSSSTSSSSSSSTLSTSSSSSESTSSSSISTSSSSSSESTSSSSISTSSSSSSSESTSSSSISVSTTSSTSESTSSSSISESTSSISQTTT